MSSLLIDHPDEQARHAAQIMQRQIDDQRAELDILRARSYTHLVHDASELARFEEIVRATIDASKSPRAAIVVSLFCRSKYESEDAKSGKSLHAVLDQDLYTPHSQLDRIIHRFSLPQFKDGHVRPYTYKTSSDEAPRVVPNHTLVVYMNMNPRNQLEPLMDLHRKVIGNAVANLPLPERLDHAFIREVHRGKQDHQYVELDIDTKDRDIIVKTLGDSYQDIIKRVAFAVETRGGYHLVFRKESFPEGMYKLCKLPVNEYKELSRDNREVTKKYVDIQGDVCVPVPGTLQGGFPVRLIDASTLLDV